MRLFPLAAVAAFSVVLLGAAAPPDPTSAPSPGYDAALARATQLNGEPSFEPFRGSVLKAVLAALPAAATACQPGPTPPYLGLVFKYRGRSFDRVETSTSTPLARCMAQALAAKATWPTPPVDDFAVAFALEPRDAPRGYDDPGPPTPGYPAAFARIAPLMSNPEANRFRDDVLEKTILERLSAASLEACVPRHTKMKFVLVFSYRDRRFDSIETDGLNAISACLIGDLKTNIDWPTAPVDGFAMSLAFDFHD